MPNVRKYYEPDAMDCNTLMGALHNDFGALCELITDYGSDQVVVYARCFKAGELSARVVLVQAKVAAPLKTARSLYIMQYSALLDCWHQLDRGVLAVAQTPMVRSWSGRPRTPGRRSAQ
jgi:hypothetical protein